MSEQIPDGVPVVEISAVGMQGPPGRSAYEIALDYGFEGTEEEWLQSLGGPGNGLGIPNGGATGQVLTKISEADGDADWVDPGLLASPSATVVPLTTVLGDSPYLVWTEDNQAITTEVPL